jgi:hypothetical protein
MVGLLVVVLLVIAAGVGAIAIVVSSGDDTPVVELEVGDCFDLPDDVAGDVLGSVDTVDCSEPHLAEVVANGALNAGGDAPYPTDDELFDLVERACRAADAVGSDDFGLLPIAPTPELWASFEGRFLCVAIPFGGDPVTGSIIAD